jgi:hypothetical protein
VVQLCKKPRFALESIETLSLFRKLLGENFNSDVTRELRVASAVDLAHASFADRLEDLVVCEIPSPFDWHVAAFYCDVENEFNVDVG